MCTCTHMQVFVTVFAHAERMQRPGENFECSVLLFSILLVLRQGFLTDSSSPFVQLGRLASKPQGCFCLCNLPPQPLFGLQVCLAASIDVGKVDSSSYAWLASAVTH